MHGVFGPGQPAWGPSFGPTGAAGQPFGPTGPGNQTFGPHAPATARPGVAGSPLAASALHAAPAIAQQPGPALCTVSRRVAHQVRRSDDAALHHHTAPIDTELREVRALLAQVEDALPARRGQRAADGGPASARRGPDADDGDVFVSIHDGPDTAPWVSGDTRYDEEGNLRTDVLVDDERAPVGGAHDGRGHGGDQRPQGPLGELDHPAFRDAAQMLLQVEQRLAGLPGAQAHSAPPPRPAPQTAGTGIGQAPVNRPPAGAFATPRPEASTPPAHAQAGGLDRLPGTNPAGTADAAPVPAQRSPSVTTVTGHLFDETVPVVWEGPLTPADYEPPRDQIPVLLASLSEARAPIAERLAERVVPLDSRRADQDVLRSQAAQLSALLGLIDGKLTQSTWVRGAAHESLGPVEDSWHRTSLDTAIALQNRAVYDADRTASNLQILHAAPDEQAAAQAAQRTTRQGLAELIGPLSPYRQG
jgi:hypothetical protein